MNRTVRRAPIGEFGIQRRLSFAGGAVTAVLLALSSCTAGGSVPSGKPAKAAEARFGVDLPRAIDDFGAALLKAASVEAGANRNVVVSPVSVHAALSMTSQGATGETAQQMRTVLRTASMDAKEANAQWAALLAGLGSRSPEQELAIAHALFARKGIVFRQPFVDADRAYFGAQLSTLDFVTDDVRGAVNGWVAKNTRGMVTEILDQVDPRTILYLANAAYFKGDWVTPFGHESTAKRSFKRADGVEVRVDMMYTRRSLPFAENDLLQATSLPYKGAAAAFYVMLPRPGVSLDAAMSSLEGTGFSDLRMAMTPPDTSEVLLGLPKLDTEFFMPLKKPLTDMGMPRAFDTMRAEFSAMADLDVPIFIQEVLHKTRVKVDEKGTEAAAATVVAMAPGAAPKPVRAEILCDRPYLFAIVDVKTGTMLFLGAVGDPARSTS